MVCLSIIGCSSNVYSGHDADAWPGFLGQFAVVCADAVGVDSPYEITLLSNNQSRHPRKQYVLIPYEITLLSNQCISILQICIVLIPYEITLLSNLTVNLS